MLRDAGVRTKLLAVLAIPTLLLVVVTALLVGGQVSQARRAGQVNALTDVAIQVNRVVHSLQEERSATLAYLQEQTAGNEARMDGQRQFTNLQLRTLRSLVVDSPLDEMSASVQAAVARSAAGHDELRSARASIDAGRFFATETDVFYGRVIRADLDLPGVIASSGTPELAQVLQAYEALSSSIEYASHERDLVEIALLSGELNEAEFAQTSALVAQQRTALQDFQGKAPADLFGRLENRLAQAENYEIDQVRRDLPRLLKVSEPDFGASVQWVGAANSRISVMTETESALVSVVAEIATDTQTSQEQRALLLVTFAVLGLALAIVLAVGLARRITRPLRRLTVAAGDIGDELPRMVERMQTPGEGPGVEVEPIPVESRDEIGRLAEAFNTVNDVTVQVAKEQAALRASIAEMFVNVARRNQVLLGRQLKALDAMEAGEEDPDVLERLFTLDHLATRMRRNAESLLVLAGIDSTRRLRNALPLSDVIRTAVGEIEAFDRIDLSMSDDPDVSGRYALTVAHLLAEVLENATHFSNPETRVVVAASMTGHGVDVTVTDYGLGMTQEEIDEANEKIARPPVTEIAVSQRLGLFVVGRLAARLGATVTLRRGRAAGTVVTASLPVSVFEGRAVAQLDPVDDAAPPAEDERVDHDVAPDADEPAPATVEKPARRWGLRRGRKPVSSESEPVEEPVAEQPVAEAPVEEPVAEAVEVQPDEQQVDEPAPAAEPAAEPEPVAVEEAPASTPEPLPAPERPPAPEPMPEPQPVAPVVFAPAVDVLPSRSTGRFGRNRSPLPSRHPAAAPSRHPRPPAAVEPTRPESLVDRPAPAAPPAEQAPAEPVAEPTAVVEPTAEPTAVVEPTAEPTAEPPAEPTAAPAAPAPATAALPARSPVAAEAPMPPAPSDDLERMTMRSDLTSSALSELRGLYEPSFVPTPARPAADTPDTGLARRTPKVAPARAAAPPPPSTRQRSANEVRGMLTGFRAGVERGRAPQASDAAIDDQTS